MEPMHSRAQGLPITTIVIAALALMVLVILFAVLTGRLGGFGKTIASCDSRGGVCIERQACKGAIQHDIKCLGSEVTESKVAGRKLIILRFRGEDVVCCIELE